jgi:two-component system NtrC family sensor kinase
VLWRQSETRVGGGVALVQRGRLFGKYVALFVAVVCVALVVNGLFDSWISFQEQKALLGRVQHEQAKGAALRIEVFGKELRGQLGWATQFPWKADAADAWQFDAERLCFARSRR